MTLTAKLLYHAKNEKIQGGWNVKKIKAIALACLIALSSSVVSLQAFAAEDEDLVAVAIDNKGKFVGVVIGCVVFFPLGCIIGGLVGWGYDDVVEPMIVGEDSR